MVRQGGGRAASGLPALQAVRLGRGDMNHTKEGEPGGRESPASRDGCTCPAWVVRCARWDGQRLAPTTRSPSDDGVLYGHTCKGGLRPFTDEGFGVHLSPAGLVACGRTEGCPALVLGKPCDPCLELSDLPAAEAEFEKRAEELRQGVEAS